MRIVTLVENTCRDGLGCAHGLSMYAETNKHKILFDAGPDGELLLNNAESLGVDLEKVDIAVLSHGHYDHAGGLRSFLEKNKNARVYIHTLAASRGHYATETVGWRKIGIDESLLADFPGRFLLTGDMLSIDDELCLFSDISSADFVSGSNSTLFEEQDGDYIPDPFHHEQNLLIREGERLHLLAGCAHRGIINILRRAAEIGGKAPDSVFAGFHLTNPGLKQDLPESFVRLVGLELKKYPCLYYTGHCTGAKPFAVLKDVLGDRVSYLSGGLEVTV